MERKTDFIDTFVAFLAKKSDCVWFDWVDYINEKANLAALRWTITDLALKSNRRRPI